MTDEQDFFANAPQGPYTLNQQIECVRREITMRRNVYPRQILSGKISKPKADEQIALMEAVLRTLCKVRESSSCEKFSR